MARSTRRGRSSSPPCLPCRAVRSCRRAPPGGTGEWFGYTDDFLRANDEDGRLRRVLFLSRLVPLAEAVACGGLIFLLGRRLAGEDGGLLAAGLWFTTPWCSASATSSRST